MTTVVSLQHPKLNHYALNLVVDILPIYKSLNEVAARSSRSSFSGPLSLNHQKHTNTPKPERFSQEQEKTEKTEAGLESSTPNEARCRVTIWRTTQNPHKTTPVLVRNPLFLPCLPFN